MAKNMIPGAPLEAEKEDELRIFSIFVNQKTGTYEEMTGETLEI